MQNIHSHEKPLLLVFAYDVMAHYLRCLQLCTYLKPYFHIRFIYSARFHSFVTNAGFVTFECAALNAEKVHQCMVSFDFSWLNERDLNFIYQSQLKTINQLKPAAVLGDMVPTLQMAAEKTGVFHFSVINGYMTRYYAFVRRMPSQYPLYKLFNFLPNSLFRYLTNFGEELFFEKMHRPFSKIRRRAGLSPRHSYMQELEGDVNLVCDLPDLFPQNNLPPNYVLIPPLFHQANNDAFDLSRLDKNKKTIYVSMGSTGSWKDVAFLNGKEYHKYNIVTAGDHQKVLQGPNVVAYSFISSDGLFNATDLVICHGGNGTIYQALSYGIPILCKTSHVEQEYNVDGLERLQLGKCLDDINHNGHYLQVVDEWIERKNSKELESIKYRILQVNSRFEKIIEDMLKDHFFKNHFQKELFSSKLNL